jgi:hypothetical protein
MDVPDSRGAFKAFLLFIWVLLTASMTVTHAAELKPPQGWRVVTNLTVALNASKDGRPCMVISVQLQNRDFFIGVGYNTNNFTLTNAPRPGPWFWKGTTFYCPFDPQPGWEYTIYTREDL